MASETSASAPRWHRLAEQVAADLRERILSGELEDGDVLPKEELLRATYPISKPSLREAMRILETEGLISVRRGNIGGAVVRWPSAANVAYTASLVLRAQQSTLEAIGEALLVSEPACFVLCAQREDRMRTVIPKLRALQQQSLTHVSDLAMSTDLAHQFHAVVIDLCGNEPLRVMVGALEKIWTSHRSHWADRVTDPNQIPVGVRLRDLMLHEQMIELIAAGEAEQVRNLTAEHLTVRRHYLELGPSADVAQIDPGIVQLETAQREHRRAARAGSEAS